MVWRIQNKHSQLPESANGKPFVNTRQEADTPEKFYINTDSISKFENKDKPRVTDKDKINYFLRS